MFGGAPAGAYQRLLFGAFFLYTGPHFSSSKIPTESNRQASALTEAIESMTRLGRRGRGEAVHFVPRTVHRGRSSRLSLEKFQRGNIESLLVSSERSNGSGGGWSISLAIGRRARSPRRDDERADNSCPREKKTRGPPATWNDSVLVDD